jgi:hypothetical protein
MISDRLGLAVGAFDHQLRVNLRYLLNDQSILLRATRVSLVGVERVSGCCARRDAILTGAGERAFFAGKRR